jgi:aspartyl-tRNA(Asn)/glutamyl-tRNA(Gln) amidotransferase subunit A
MNLQYRELYIALQQGKTTCVQLVKDYISRIEKFKHLNLFIEVFEDAIISAADVDSKIKAGKAGRLAGMIMGIKDNICYKNHHTEACSNMLKGFKPVYNATAVERLIQEDAIIIGRLNCDEFAMGGSNENSFYGPASNPFNVEYVTGGSSGGSAGAVAAGLCHAALGSDTGGSVRQPAAFCGVYGIKPSYGRISRYGLIAFASSFDQIGILTHSAEDAALILDVISGKDEKDSTSTDKIRSFTAEKNCDRLKIAVIDEALNASALDKEVKSAFYDFVSVLKADGHTVENISFPMLEYMVPAYYVLTTAEASSNLSRYSGWMYGHRSQLQNDQLSKTRMEGFGKEVQRRILLGTFVLSAGFYEAYYEKAQLVRRKINNETRKLFDNYDLILCPVSPSTAFKKGDKQDPVAMYLEDLFTVHANLTGLPAMSFPAGNHSNGLPFGFQVMADQENEETLLSFCRYTEGLKGSVNA